MALTERKEPKDVVDLYCGTRAPGAPEIDALVGDAERKFGVRGIRDMLRARFLAELPLLTSLEMRTSVAPWSDALWTSLPGSGHAGELPLQAGWTPPTAGHLRIWVREHQPRVGRARRGLSPDQ